MSEMNDNGVTLSLIAAGMSTYDRKRKADRQPRDSSGRWVGAGANVRWRSNGQDWAGTVEKIINGKAVVKVRHSDGSHSQTTLLPSTLKVMASKARLSSVNRKYFDENALTSDYIQQHQRNIQRAAENGGARIERPDGYSVDVVAKKDDPEKDKDKDKNGNALLYQLYAPNGSSRGIYSTPGAIDSAIGAETPAPVRSSAMDIDVEEEESPKAFNLPKDMIEPISQGLYHLSGIISDEDLVFFSKFVSGEPVTYEDVEILGKFASVAKYLPLLYGGQDGLEWIDKIIKKPTPEAPSYDFNDPTYEYFASITDGVVDLLAVDLANDKVFSWTGAGFSMEHGPIDKYDADSIEPLDSESAKKVAEQLTSAFSQGNPAVFSIADLFPEERNLFNTAMNEIDETYLDTITQLTYESAERSIDAQYQTRGQGGKFAGQTSTSDKTKGKYFAIVDSVDPTAVLDVVVVISSGATGPEVFRRAYGSWHADPEMLSQLTGPTPPNVVYLDSEAQIKDVLSQVDSYDIGDEESTEVSDNTEFGLKIKAKSFDYSNYDPDDLHELLTQAKKFNRIDLIPEEFRAYKNNISVNGMYGEYGEVLTASAYSLGNTPLERLENYWIKGEGSNKIDWNSSDSVEYATKVFSKYLGIDKAYAFATILNSKAKI